MHIASPPLMAPTTPAGHELTTPTGHGWRQRPLQATNYRTILSRAPAITHRIRAFDGSSHRLLGEVATRGRTLPGARARWDGSAREREACEGHRARGRAAAGTPLRRAQGATKSWRTAPIPRPLRKTRTIGGVGGMPESESCEVSGRRVKVVRCVEGGRGADTRHTEKLYPADLLRC